MNRARGQRTLQIDPKAHIVSDADELKVVGRRGAFLIRGKGIQELHRSLRTLLDGRFSRERLVRAAGEKGSAVEKYLDGLEQAGAMTGGLEIEPLPGNFPRAVVDAQRVQLGSLPIVICLDRLLEPRQRALLVHFGSAEQVERFLLSRKQVADGTTELVVQIDEENSGLAKRARIARHLLAVVLSRGELPGELSIYKVASDVTLRRQVVVHPRVKQQISLWTQLNIAHQAEALQAPLSVFAGEMQGHRQRYVGVGLSALDVEPRVLLYTLAQTYLAIAAKEKQCMSAALVATGTSRKRAKVTVELTPARLESAAIGRTRSDCIRELLCSCIVRHLHGTRGRRCDLLREAPASPRISMLQRLLGLRRDSYAGCLDDAWDPFVVFRGQGIVVARLAYEETIAAALVRAVASEFYSSMNPDVIAVPASATTSSERRSLDRALRNFPAPASFAISRVRGLGFTFHAGFELESGASANVPDPNTFPSFATQRVGEGP